MRILARKGQVERSPLGLEPGAQRRLVRAVDRLLRQARRDRALLGDLAGDALGLVEPGLPGDDAGDETCLQRLARREPAAAEDQVHRQRLADGAGQPLRSAGAGDDPEAGLRLAELGGLGGDDQVTAHGQLAAAAQAVAGDRGDERCPEPADRVPALDAALVVEVDRRGLCELADVGAGGEGPLAAAEHDRAHRLVAVELRERLHELVHQLVGERVQRLGPVEQDDRDRAVALDLDQAHFFSRNFSIAAFGSSVAIERASQSRAWLIVSCQAKSRQKFRCCFA